jgi:hypothetical protein
MFLTDPQTTTRKDRTNIAGNDVVVESHVIWRYITNSNTYVGYLLSREYSEDNWPGRGWVRSTTIGTVWSNSKNKWCFSGYKGYNELGVQQFVDKGSRLCKTVEQRLMSPDWTFNFNETTDLTVEPTELTE